MQTRQFPQLPGLALAALLILLIGSAAAEPRSIVGTWNVTLRFPECTTACPCPGGTSNLPIPALHQYQRHGALVEVSGGSPLRGPGVGSWERFDHHQYEARFKFFLFNADGSRRGSEEVTSHILLTDTDEFTATSTFDLFDANGDRTSPEDGCPINVTARRFE